MESHHWEPFRVIRFTVCSRPLRDYPTEMDPEAGLEPATQGHCGPPHYHLCYSGEMAPETGLEPVVAFATD